MKRFSKPILTAAALVAAMGVLGGAAWTAGDFTEIRPVLLKEYRIAQAQFQNDQLVLQQQVQQVQQVQQLQRFQQLDMKRTFGALNWDEIQERCKIAQALGYVMSLVDGCK